MHYSANFARQSNVLIFGGIFLSLDANSESQILCLWLEAKTVGSWFLRTVELENNGVISVCIGEI